MKLQIIIGSTLLSISLAGCQQAEISSGSEERAEEVQTDTVTSEETEENTETEEVVEPADKSTEPTEPTEPAESPENETESAEKPEETETDSNEEEPAETVPDEEQSVEETETVSEPDVAVESGTISNPVVVENPTSVKVLVNKTHKLPDGYVPPDLVVPDVPFPFEEDHPKKQMRQEAAAALEELFQASSQAGLELFATSGYRSYERQKAIYQNNVRKMGQAEADKFSARPGTSEHQTGLAMDVTSAEMGFSLEQSFGQTDEGVWLADNAHRFGFIIRYPEGQSAITGYSYEPWHIRYIGKEAATEVYEQGITLEEYFAS